ncbi:MAG: peroxiredoxin [Gammaproteobacteria bacterium]|nr:peroxiredoxin [Gammaproteobacteria bacterium]
MSKRLLATASIGALAALLLTVPALAALQPGAKAPVFTAEASLAGEEFTFSLDQALARGPVVLYFYPAAFTHGCDVEAHTFATHKAQFTAAGATIIGVSADSIQRLNRFSSDPDYCAGKFPVASDPGGRIAADYGLEMIPPQKGVVDVNGNTVEHGFIPRTTFVLDGSGEIVAVFSTSADKLTPVQHVTKSLAIVEKMQAEKSGK